MKQKPNSTLSDRQKNTKIQKMNPFPTLLISLLRSYCEEDPAWELQLNIHAILFVRKVLGKSHFQQVNSWARYWVCKLLCLSIRSLDIADGIRWHFKIFEVATFAKLWFNTITLSSSKSKRTLSLLQFSTSWHKCFKFSTSIPLTFLTCHQKLKIFMRQVNK